MSKNHLHVTCAIIEQDGCVLAAQRSRSMAMPLKWEFPGGKIKPGETPEHCLCREIAEELAIDLADTACKLMCEMASFDEAKISRSLSRKNQVLKDTVMKEGRPGM
ncbi:MAG: NUDIX domain-containing protein [Desulfotignum sp.]|nr:NUDIX domain-containing protein [Desulfotignum sp.]